MDVQTIKRQRKTLNVIRDGSGFYAAVLRGAKIRRYKRLTPASLARCKCVIRKQLCEG